MSTPLRVLIVEDVEADALLMVHELRRGGFAPEWRRVETEEAYLEALQSVPEIILSDNVLPQFDSQRALARLQECALDVPFIIVSGSIGEDVAVAAMRQGASDYLLKDRLARLGPAVVQALAQQRLREKCRRDAQALRAAEERSSQILETANDAFLAIDAEGRITTWNAQAERTFGWSRAEVLGRSLADTILPPQHREAHVRGLKRFLTTGEGPLLRQRQEYTALRRNGQEFPVELTVWLVHSGGTCAFNAFVRDITERKQVEEMLAERACLAALSSDIGIALTRAETLGTMLQRCSEALVRHLDAAFVRIWTHNAALGVLELQASAGLYTHLDGPHCRVPLGHYKVGRIAQERKPYLTNDVLHDPHISDPEWAQREGMVAFAGHPLLVESRLLGVLALFARRPLRPALLDALPAVADTIALGLQRKLAEDSLRSNQAQLEGFFDAASDAILVVDSSGRIVRLNKQTEATFGYEPHELLHQPVEVLLPERSREAHAQHRARYLANPSTRTMGAGMELTGRRRDGTEFPVQISLGPLRTSNEVLVVSIVRDITEQRRLEHQLRQAQKLEAVGRMAGGVAHDFNNLLTVINGYSDVLLDKLPSSNPDRLLLEAIHKAGDRAVSLTGQLLAFSSKQLLHPRVTDLNQLLTDMNKQLRSLLGDDVECRVLPGSALWPVLVDPEQLRHVVMNLALNSRAAMPAGGQVTLETANCEVDAVLRAKHPEIAPGEYVQLALTDTGCGMEKVTLACIFEPFYTTKEPNHSPGLALAVAYGIIKQSGGFIYVYSEPGHGTTFRIYLPRYRGTESQAEVRPVPQTLPHGLETILLAEDDDAVRKLTARVLREWGYTVLEARNGQEGLQVAAAQAGTIHLLLTDVIMPLMGGKEMAEQVTAMYPDLKVLYVSGSTANVMNRQGVLEPEINFLQKPFTRAMLANKVRELLDAPR